MLKAAPAQQRFKHELSLKWPNPSGAKRPASWHMPHGGRFEIGRLPTCQAIIPDFSWSRFLLFIQDSLNDYGIDLHLIEGMQAVVASPLAISTFGPQAFRDAIWMSFQHYWVVRLPERCCGRIVVAGTPILFQRNHYPYRHLPNP